MKEEEDGYIRKETEERRTCTKCFRPTNSLPSITSVDEFYSDVWLSSHSEAEAMRGMKGRSDNYDMEKLKLSNRGTIFPSKALIRLRNKHVGR